MNWLTAAEALIRIQATAAQGADDDDGVVIADGDLIDLSRIAAWLLQGAVSAGEINIGRVVDVLPTVNIDMLHRVASEQALELHRGEVGEACKALGVNQTTLWRWREKWKRQDRAMAAYLDSGDGRSGQSRPDVARMPGTNEGRDSGNPVHTRVAATIPRRDR